MNLALFFFVTSKSDTEANGSKTDSTSCMKKMRKREEGKGSRFPGWEMTLGRAEEDRVRVLFLLSLICTSVQRQR